MQWIQSLNGNLYEESTKQYWNEEDINKEDGKKNAPPPPPPVFLFS